ncbi:MAG: nitroreductase family protein [Bacteroidales bacterium]|nr:nitroreductase family protein [Bacteroidales bacterium]
MKRFLNLVITRQSVRRYKPDPVDPEQLKRCLEAARLSPSASNSQPWTFIVVNEPTLREKVARETFSTILSFNKFVLQAPALVVFVIEKPKLITRIGANIKNKEYPLIDIGIAAEHFCLQAAEEGLGTCMLGWFNEKPIKSMLNIPAKKTIGLIITLGHPAEGYRLRKKSRKDFDEVVRFNSY